jgi:hypothetical protein
VFLFCNERSTSRKTKNLSKNNACAVEAKTTLLRSRIRGSVDDVTKLTNLRKTRLPSNLLVMRSFLDVLSRELLFDFLKMITSLGEACDIVGKINSGGSEPLLLPSP